MSTPNPQIDRFLQRAKKWHGEMEKLRAISLSAPLLEELKWGKPCYSFDGSNVVIIQGFKEHCALLFCKGALLKDPAGILQKPGESTQGARRASFTSLEQINQLEETLKAYIAEAIEVQKSGAEPEYKKNPEPVPEELQRKFASDPAFEEAFSALTPGRQRGYLLYFNGAKQSQTRTSRIEKSASKIFDGKGMLD